MTASIMIMAGGTGGHIFPGLAVASELQRRGAHVSWLGAEGGMETRSVPAHGIDIEIVRISGLRGKGLRGWVAMPLRLLRAVRDAGRILKQHRPDCVVSFGGYVAGPGGLAAWVRGIPLVVHEQNRIPGMTNRNLARFAKRILQAFPGAFPDGSRVACVGNPVRAEVISLPAPAERWAERSGATELLVTGGSQGARALNHLLPEALALLPENVRPGVTHQAGRGQVKDTLSRYEAAGVDAVVCEFIDDMAAAYATADLVVCRSGALTVSELAAAGVGALLVPFPHAVDDHQTANGRFLEEAGGAQLLPEQTLDATTLAARLEPLLTDQQQALAMAQAARSVAMPDAAARVADACLAEAKS